MSLMAVWRNDEEPERAATWVATDSRISGPAGALLDEGGKLFSLPVVCRGPDSRGFFLAPYFAQDLGLACVGSTLIYQHVYACLVPLLSSLNGDGTKMPAIEDIAQTTANVTAKYVSSLGQSNPQAHRVGLVLTGYCVPHDRHEAYRFEPQFNGGLFSSFASIGLDLEGGRTHFFGDHVADAYAALELERVRVANDHPISWHRAPIRIVRQFIDEPKYGSIGGDVQLGFTSGADFTRVATVAPRVVGEATAYMRFNNIDLDEIGQFVGPCRIGISGMVGLT